MKLTPEQRYFRLSVGFLGVWGFKNSYNLSFLEGTEVPEVGKRGKAKPARGRAWTRWNPREP